MKHLVVIPTYNESENIEDLINRIFQLYKDISILIVDDSSPDNTSGIVRNLQQKYASLYLLIQKEKQGLANAYINGFKWGIDNGFDLFTSCDGDFSHNPIYISHLVKKIEEGYDIASGSRYIKGGGTTEKNFFRNFISIGGNIWADFILRTKMKDILEGYSTYTKNALEKINLDSIKAKGYIFQAEMKYKAFKNGLKIAEVPILFETRTTGKSKMDFAIIFEALISVIKLKFKDK